MGKRSGRKRTRKAKEQQPVSSGDSPRRGGTAMAEASGYHHCDARGQRIALTVCLVKQGRTPEECRGCEHHRG